MKPLMHYSLGQFLKRQGETYENCPALWYKNHIWSYQELDRISDEFAAGFLQAGVEKGSHVAIWADAVPEKIFLFYALEKIGAVAVMVNHCLGPEEVKELMILADAEYLIWGDGKQWLDAPWQQLFTQLQLKKIFYLGKEKQSWPHLISIDELRQAGRANPVQLPQALAAVCPKDPALILFTSGTTGKVKAVLSSHFHLVNGGIQKADSMNASSTSVFCSALPLCHIFGIDVNLLAALASGGCLALPESLNTFNILKTIQKAKCTHLSAVPSIFLSLIARPDFSNFDISSLQTGIVGGAYCSSENFCKIDRTLDFTLLPGLGQTEATAGIAIGALDMPLLVRSTTVGTFVPYMAGRITDIETGEEKPVGELGELCIKGPLLMTGYYGETAAEAFDPAGWFHTGDLAFVDENGNLVLGGRLKEIINRGGEKIMPGELESILHRDQRIKQCKVIPVPDTHYGEEICACVVKNREITEQEVIALLEPRVARFKLPRHIIFFDSLPHTQTGKIKIKETAAQALERIKNPFVEKELKKETQQ